MRRVQDPLERRLPQESVIDRFRRMAGRRPDARAVLYFDTSISFGELDRMSNALAAAMQDVGIRRGDRVALYLQNVPQFWIAQLAAWKLGAIVVPLNPMFKERELVFHLTDSGSRLLVCLESLFWNVARRVVDRTPVQTVLTTSELDFLPAGSLPAPLQASKQWDCPGTQDLLTLCEHYTGARDPGDMPDLQDTAILAYTSGTTGPPKGAMNTHGNVAYNAAMFAQWIDLHPDRDVIVGAAPLFHITGLILHLALASISGAPLVLGYRFEPGEFLRLIERWRGTFMVAPITAYIALMNHAGLGRHDLSALREKAYSGGAPVPPATVAAFESSTGIYIHNAYGLTESTAPCVGTPLGRRAPVDPDTGTLSIGVPLPGVELRVVDMETGDEKGSNELGELVIRGPMVIRGYWNKPDETRHAIRDGWLYTGDIGWLDEAGWVYIADRRKDMIIASGFKIWPREVEDVLYQHDAVREAAVVGIADAYRGETVKAVVSLKPDVAGTVTAEDLKAYCRERLAAYKCPKLLEVLPDLPKTASGKILKRFLR